ncbi:DUF6210 family protein [Solwaraspora sp. WMMB762]|uniref:DUF6210 family protein n=1 Tax=Solwaraspora sp. WMMB762 TaxID=3404120 RepID=UPI003B930D1C
MSGGRFVFLDPDGTAGMWIHLVVEARTGVVYQQQYGGTACRQGQVEGFLVPMADEDALDALRELFEKDFRGAGTRNRAWSEPERSRLRRIIGGITYWACDRHSQEPHALQLDESRMHEADEAWIPVTTPDGPGMLVWYNSD